MDNRTFAGIDQPTTDLLLDKKQRKNGGQKQINPGHLQLLENDVVKHYDLINDHTLIVLLERSMFLLY